jgi:hypothetical protein
MISVFNLKGLSSASLFVYTLYTEKEPKKYFPELPHLIVPELPQLPHLIATLITTLIAKVNVVPEYTSPLTIKLLRLADN